MVFAAIDPVIGIVGAALAAAIGAYLAAVRKMSGKVGSSDADQLWNESRDMRNVLLNQTEKQALMIGGLQTEIAGVKDSNNALMVENRHLVEEVAKCSVLIGQLREEITNLTGKLVLSSAKVEELQYDVDNPPKRRSTDHPSAETAERSDDERTDRAD